MSFPHDFKEHVDQISFPDSMEEMEKYIKEEQLLEHLATDDNAFPDLKGSILAVPDFLQPIQNHFHFSFRLLAIVFMIVFSINSIIENENYNYEFILFRFSHS
jgi:hypothetical protein